MTETEEKVIAPMPKFDFSNSDVTTDEQMEAELAKAAGGKYLAPGRYEVKISEVKWAGLAKGDSTWGMLDLKLLSGEKEASARVYLPFASPKYGEKQTMIMFKKFKSFCEALEVSVTVASLEQTMKDIFANEGKRLVGARLAVTIGYENGYLKYAGKGEDSVARYNLCTADGNPVCGADKQPLVFADKAAGQAYAQDNQIRIDPFPRVTQYEVATGGSGLSTNDPW